MLPVYSTYNLELSALLGSIGLYLIKRPDSGRGYTVHLWLYPDPDRQAPFPSPFVLPYRGAQTSMGPYTLIMTGQ